MARSRVAVVALVLTLASSGTAGAVDRLTRLHARDDGLPSAVNAYAQDANGYIWVGSEIGLTRYDGRVFEPWATDQLNELVHWIATGPTGRVLVFIRGKRAWEIVGRHAAPLLGPDGAQLTDVHRAVFAPDGALWIARDGAVRRASPDGAWGPRVELPDDRAYGIAIDPDGFAYVGGGRALWRVPIDGPPERLADAPAVISDVIALDGGGCAYTATLSGKAFVYRDGAAVEIAHRDSRATGVVERNGRLWIAWADHLGYVDPGRPVVAQPLQHSGEPMVDREGSLWLATYEGLVQYPEPDTAVYALSDGLESSHVRAVAESDEGVWFNAWAAKPTLLDPDTQTINVMHDDWHMFSSATLCTDAGGAVWGAGRGGLAERRGGEWIVHALDGVRFADRCSVAPDGRVWFATDAGLYVAGLGDAPTAVAPLPSSWLQSAYEDASGRLWIGWEENVCHGSASAARAGDDPAWQCDVIEGSIHPNDFAETAAGTLWLSTRQAGIWYWSASGWKQLPSSLDLAGRDVRALVDSPRGGMWVLTAAAVLRVVEGETPEAPWTIVEELGPWNGMSRPGAAGVHESADGTVWLTTSAGLTRIPPRARDQRRPAPPVSIVSVRRDGREVDLGETIELDYGDHQLELEFSGPTFRDRTLLRYRIRLGVDRTWSNPTRTPVFNFVNLAPGHYRVEVVASLDGHTWSELSAEYAFDVALPWWRRPWVWVLALALAFGVAFAVHRARLLVALRLERQRTRIAADLHDEMGSGLGSIGLLAGVASETGKTEAVADKIADTAAELGDALTDIVWSLRAGSGAPAELAAHLTRKGETLFPGGGASFTTELPERWPRTQLSLPVRRNLQLIASEALHNAARHAGADNVTLGMAASGKRWALWIEDDGAGIDPNAPPTGSGLGLDNMRRRAREIGAQIDIGPARRDRGTRISLRFDPRARDRRIP